MRRVLLSSTIMTVLISVLAVSGCDSESAATPDLMSDMGVDQSVDQTPDATSEPDTTAVDTVEDMGPVLPPVCMTGEVMCGTGGDLETCTDGQWTVTEACALGCKATSLACAEAGDGGTCGDAIVIGLGTPYTGTTDTVYNPNTWSAECTSRYAMQTGSSLTPLGPETVYRVTVPEPQYLTVSLTAPTATYFALYMRGACNNPGSELQRLCGGNSSQGTSYELEGFFGAGTYDIVVDSFAPGDGGSVGEFTLLVEPALLPACGAVIPLPLDVSEPVMLNGDTADGQTAEDWNGALCPVIQSTSGRENVYVFGLNEPTTVNIAVTPIEPATSQVAVYLRTVCDDRYEQAACGHTDGNGPAVISELLDAGAYYLFVDDFSGSIDEEQTYELTITTD